MSKIIFKKIQINICFKIMLKLIFYYHIVKTVVNDYGFKFFLKIKVVVGDYGFRFKVINYGFNFKTAVINHGFNFKIAVINHGFNFKPKTVVTNYDFNFLKKFKIIVTKYSF